jgi:hypothetical protein
MTEKTKQWIAAILFTLFFIIASLCSSQVQRIARHHDKKIVTLLPEKPMKFNAGENDTIFVSILADSVGKSDYNVSVFMFMPKSKFNINYSIQIGFEDGSSIELYSSTSAIKYNFLEYEIDEEYWQKLKACKFDLISFNHDNIVEPCVNIRTKDYFIIFLNSLK